MIRIPRATRFCSGRRYELGICVALALAFIGAPAFAQSSGTFRLYDDTNGIDYIELPTRFIIKPTAGRRLLGYNQISCDGTKYVPQWSPLETSTEAIESWPSLRGTCPDGSSVMTIYVWMDYAAASGTMSGVPNRTMLLRYRNSQLEVVGGGTSSPIFPATGGGAFPNTPAGRLHAWASFAAFDEGLIGAGGTSDDGFATIGGVISVPALVRTYRTAHPLTASGPLFHPSADTCHSAIDAANGDLNPVYRGNSTAYWYDVLAQYEVVEDEGSFVSGLSGGSTDVGYIEDMLERVARQFDPDWFDESGEETLREIIQATRIAAVGSADSLENIEVDADTIASKVTQMVQILTQIQDLLRTTDLEETDYLDDLGDYDYAPELTGLVDDTESQFDESSFTDLNITGMDETTAPVITFPILYPNVSGGGFTSKGTWSFDFSVVDSWRGTFHGLLYAGLAIWGIGRIWKELTLR